MKRPRGRAFAEWTALVAAMAVTSPALAADYGALGTESAGASDIPTGTAGAPSGKLLVPNGAGPYPLIVAIHGWSAAADNQVGWATHFASWGFVVVVPDLPNPFSPDTMINEQIVVDLARTYADPTFASPAQGKVDAANIGLEGHSAGGLAAVVAASELAPRATVLFDPVDNGGVGKNAYAKLCTPVLALFAAPGSCNQTGEWSGFKNATLGPLVVADVVGATHCDGENAARALCGAFCGGGASNARQVIHARYATAFFLAHLKGDAAAAATLSASALAADGALAKTSARTTTQPSCSSSVDAGPDSGNDAGKANGGGASDEDATAAATAGDGGASRTSSGNGVGPASGAGGGGCSVGGESVMSASAAIAALALVRRMRRRAPADRHRGKSSRS